MELRPALAAAAHLFRPGTLREEITAILRHPVWAVRAEANASSALGANVLNSLSLSALAGDAVAIAIEFCEVIGRILGDVTYAVCLGLAAVVVWTSSTSYWS